MARLSAFSACGRLSVTMPAAPRSSKRIASLATSSFALDARGLYDGGPLRLFLIDVGSVFLGRARQGLDTLAGEALQHLFGLQRRAQLFVEPLHDRPRRSLRREEAVTQDRLVARQACLGHGSQV